MYPQNAKSQTMVNWYSLHCQQHGSACLMNSDAANIQSNLPEASKRITKKRQTKIAADNILIFYFYLSKKIRLDFSCESSA